MSWRTFLPALTLPVLALPVLVACGSPAGHAIPATAGGAAATAPARAASPGARSTPVVVLSDAAPVEIQSEEDPTIPDTFAVSGSTVYLDDPVHDTLRRYQAGKYSGSVSLGDVQESDLQVSGSTLTALEPDGTVHTFSLTGTTAKAIRTQSVELTTNTRPNLTPTAVASSPVEKVSDADFVPDARAEHLDQFDGRLVVQSDDDSRSLVDASGVTRLSASSVDTEHFATTGNGFSVLNSSGAIVKRIVVPHTPGTIEALYSGGGYDYYQADGSYFTADGALMDQSYVFRFTTAGEPAGAYTLADSDTTPPNREVQIADGQVYQLVLAGKKAEVLRLSPDTGSATAAAGQPGPKAGSGSPSVVTATKAAKPKKLPLVDTVFQAVRMAHLSWTFTKSTNGTLKRDSTARKAYPVTASRVREPRYLAAALKKPGKQVTVTGYPYTWGGYDSLNTSSNSKGKTGWKNFVSGVTKGLYTGNTTSKSAHWVPNTIGVDCSGLVSAAFRPGKTKMGTGSLVDGFHFKYVKNQDGQLAVKRGDLLIHNGHVAIVLYVLSDRKWVIGEATTKGKNTDRVMHWTRTQDSFRDPENPYRVARYQNWNMKG